MIVTDFIFSCIIESFIEDRALLTMSRYSFTIAVILNYLYEIGYCPGLIKVILSEPCVLVQFLSNLVLAFIGKLLRIVIPRKLVPEFQALPWIEICSSENTFIEREMDRFLIIYLPLLLLGILVCHFSRRNQ